MLSKNDIVLVECPRDAIQGMKEIISAEKKATHINNLIKSNLFDWIDFGSFVSPKAIPQMADTKEVLEKILNYMEKKYISIPMVMAKDILVKE
jgi:hydroxymethylglutaryl-CoA lyase